MGRHPLGHAVGLEAVQEVALVGGELGHRAEDRGEAPHVDEERADGHQRAAEHQARLDDVGPDHRLDAAHRGVETRDHREGHDRDQVGRHRRHALGAEARLVALHEEPVGEHHHQRGDEQARARGQRAHEQEQGRDVRAAQRAETHAQVVVDRVDAEAVVGLEEHVAHDDAAQDQPHDDLHVGEAARGVALDRHAQEGGGAGLGRDDGGHHRPPRHPAAREGEVAQAAVPPAQVEADDRDHQEVAADDDPVDHEMGVARAHAHGSLSRTGHPEPSNCAMIGSRWAA